MKGLIHIYTGDGKGKTTAALGLALRAAGRGKRVLFVQFLKGSQTGELLSLKKLPNVTVLRPENDYGFYFQLSDAQKAALCKEHERLLNAAFDAATLGTCDLLILDEVIPAYTLGALDRIKLLELVSHKPEELELVLTGRDAPEELLQYADYITEMRCIRHPYEKGLPAREGVEY